MLYRVNTEDNENKLRVVSWPDFQWVTNSQKIKQKFQTNKKNEHFSFNAFMKQTNSPLYAFWVRLNSAVIVYVLTRQRASTSFQILYPLHVHTHNKFNIVCPSHNCPVGNTQDRNQIYLHVIRHNITVSVLCWPVLCVCVCPQRSQVVMICSYAVAVLQHNTDARWLCAGYAGG